MYLFLHRKLILSYKQGTIPRVNWRTIPHLVVQKKKNLKNADVSIILFSSNKFNYVTFGLFSDNKTPTIIPRPT